MFLSSRLDEGQDYKEVFLSSRLDEGQDYKEVYLSSRLDEGQSFTDYKAYRHILSQRHGQFGTRKLLLYQI